MIFKETKFKTHYAEVNQSLDMKFAFVYKEKGVLTNQMQWAKCRDFLGDALHAEQEKATKGIYSFYWNPKKNKMYKSKLMFAIKFPDLVSMGQFLYNFVHFVPQLQQKCQVSFGDVVLMQEQDLVLVIEAPVFWRKSVVAISLYTYFMKCFGYKLDVTKPILDAVSETTYEYTHWDGSKSTKQTLEARYLDELEGKLPKMLENVKKLTAKLSTVHGHPKGTPMNTIHNQSGFHSVIKWGSGLVGKRFQELA